MRIGRVDLKQLQGVNEKAVGLTKEVVGVLVGNDRLQNEGSQQQQRGSEQLEAFRKEVEAQRAEVKAATLEQRQKAAQRTKEAHDHVSSSSS